MIRSLCSLALAVLALPVPAFAQAPAPKAPAARPAAPGAKPATPAPAAQRPAARRPAAPAAATGVPQTDEEKIVYAIGLLMQRSLGQFDLSAAELEIIKRALSDASAGKPAVDLNEWGPQIEPLADARRSRIAMREKVASAAYLTKAAAEPGAVKTDSGLVYRDVSAGTGVSPKASDTVRVHYRGTLTNGTVFDSSYDRNEPAAFPLSGVIPCWTEGVQRMKVGGKAHLVCPSDLAYGDQGRPTIPGGAALVFDVELLEILSGAAAPPQN